MDEGKAVLAGLDPLFERAAREGLWFWCNYQDIWFSPDELRQEHREGHYIWGAINWRLRDPREHLAEIEQEITRLKTKKANFMARM